MALATFPFGVSLDVGIVLSDFMNDTAIGCVEIENFGLASGTDFTNPIFGLFGNAICTLTLIISNVDTHTGNFSTAAGKRHGDNMLKSAEIIGFLTNQ